MGRSPHSHRPIRSSAVLRARECRALFGPRARSRIRSAGSRAARHSGRRGNNPMAADVVAQHEFTSGVPTPGTERVRMNRTTRRHAPEPPRKDVEVVIERFRIYRSRGAACRACRQRSSRMRRALAPSLEARNGERSLSHASGIDGAPNLAFLAVRSTPSPKQLTAISGSAPRRGSFVSTV